MVNRNSPKKSPAKKNISNKNAKADHKDRKLDKRTVDREDNTLHEMDVNVAVGKLEEKRKVSLAFGRSSIQNYLRN